MTYIPAHDEFTELSSPKLDQYQIHFKEDARKHLIAYRIALRSILIQETGDEPGFQIMKS